MVGNITDPREVRVKSKKRSEEWSNTRYGNKSGVNLRQKSENKKH